MTSKQSSMLFGDLASIESGFAFKSKDWLDDGLPVVKIGNVKDGVVVLDGCAFVSEETASKAKKFLASPGDVLVSLTGYVGQVGRVQEGDRVYVNQRVGLIRPKNPEDLDFIYFLLRFLKPKVEELGTGTAQANVSPSDIMKIEIPFFEPSQRKIIGQTFSNFDKKIAVNKRLAFSIEQLIVSTFESWFVNFEPASEDSKLAQSSALLQKIKKHYGVTTTTTNFGPLPKHWELSTFSEVGVSIESGSRPKGGVGGLTDGVPSIGAESIAGIGVFDYSKTKYVSEEFFNKMRRGIPTDFDVLLYKDGGKPGEFKPRLGMYGQGFPFSRFAINEHIFLLRSERVGQPYLYFWLRQEKILDYLRQAGIKAAIPGINQQDVLTLPIVIPPIELLTEFNNLAEVMIKRILHTSKATLEMGTIRDALLTRIFTGELELPEEAKAS